MKTIHFLFLLLFFALTCKSQDYIPFPESDACWKVVWYAPTPEYYSQHYDYLLDGDTLIDNVEYIKLKKVLFNIYCYQDTIYTEYVGAYRNDLESKKVYFFPYGEQQEQLLYDFSLHVGDTIPQTWQNLLYPDLIVENIDLVLIEGIYRKRFTYWNPPHPLNLRFYVFEGIGSDWGLLEAYSIDENLYYLKCFHNNDSLEYIHPGDTTCVLETDTCLYTGIISPSKINDKYFQIFNSRDQIIIQQNFYQDDLLLSVFNLTGNLIYQTSIHSNSFSLYTSQFSNGIYLFFLQNKSQILGTKKIIINH